MGKGPEARDTSVPLLSLEVRKWSRLSSPF